MFACEQLKYDTYQHKQRIGSTKQQQWVLELKQRLLQISLCINYENQQLILKKKMLKDYLEQNLINQ